jgi:hypothetical protein
MPEQPQQNKAPEPQMDAAALYREEIFTDRKMGTIRRLTPIKVDGSTDPARPVLYVGEAQILTQVGTLPLSFEIPAQSLQEAVAKFGPATKQAIDQAMRELQELRRQASSSIVIPQGGVPPIGPGGVPGGGKLKLP